MPYFCSLLFKTFQKILVTNLALGATLKRHKSVKSIEKIPCKDILVSGFSEDTSEDDIVMYFQSKKSDGGDAEMMFFDKNKNCAVVSFDEFEGK